MSTSEAARLLGVHPKTLLRWVRHGDLEPDYTTPGGHHRWRPERLARIRDEIRRNPPSRRD